MCNLAVERLKMTQILPRRSHINHREDQQRARTSKMGLAPDLEKKSINLNTKTKIHIMKCKSVSCTNLQFLHTLYCFSTIRTCCISCESKKLILSAEAAIGGVLWEKVVLEILQNSQENTCARVSFLIKLQTSACNVIKKETLAQVFSGHW